VVILVAVLRRRARMSDDRFEPDEGEAADAGGAR
jgi:hypothetical protein